LANNKYTMIKPTIQYIQNDGGNNMQLFNALYFNQCSTVAINEMTTYGILHFVVQIRYGLISLYTCT